MCGRIKKRSNMQKYKGVPKAKIEKARLNHSRKKNCKCNPNPSSETSKLRNRDEMFERIIICLLLLL